VRGLCTAAAILLLIANAASAAQPVYKSTMPDGKVIYAEKPVPGAKQVATLEPPPAATGMTAVTPAEKARVGQAKSRAAGAATQQSGLDEARRQLQQAEAARENGKEPVAGERLGTAKGGSRLNDTYFDRQKSLDAQVEAARKRVSDLERGRQ
jgi:hypothetical protein